MKKLIAILLLTSLVYQCTVKLGILAWYEINKDYVAKTLCVNKDKPQMKCCGKCYLHKQLNKAENESNDGKQQPNKMDKLELMTFIIPQGLSFQTHFSIEQKVFNSSVQSSYYFQYSSGVFHPPSVC